jgi:hypothetical protein
MNKTKNPFKSSTRILVLLIAGPLAGLAMALLLTFGSDLAPGYQPEAVDSTGTMTYTIPFSLGHTNPNDEVK